MESKYENERIKERRRNELLRGKRYEQTVRRQEAALADQRQLRTEREERWALEKREREARLVHNSWRERIEIGASLFCLLGAAALLVAGFRSGQVVLGGSGAAVSFSSALWMLLRSSLTGERST